MFIILYGKFKGKPEEKDNQLRLDKIDVYYQEAGTIKLVPLHV